MRTTPGCHFIKHYTQRVQVRPAVDFLRSGQLLWSQIRQSSGDSKVIAGGVTHPFRGQQTRQPKIQHLHLSTGRDQNIGGLQIAMDNASLMCLLQCRRKLNRIFEKLGFTQRTSR